MDGYAQWFKIEFEENAGDTSIVFQDPCIMCDTILVCVQGFRSGGDVSGRDHMEEVLIRDEGYLSS